MRVLLFLVVAFSAIAQQPSADIRDQCGAFEVRLHSASGDAMEDDMSVAIAFEGQEPIAVPLPKALFTPRVPLQNVKNVCQQLTALDAGDDRVLLLLSRNSRPSWDRLDAVLIDTRNRRILDTRHDLGEIKSKDALVARRAGTDGYDVLLIRELIPDSGCDCAEAAIEDWMRLSVQRTKVFARWTRR
jgi:hypothetical protein